MQIKRFASTAVMALAMMAQFAYAAVILQVDIADPNKIKFIATGENALINNSAYSYADGITLQKLATDNLDIDDTGMEGTLVVPREDFDSYYDGIFSDSNDLNLFVKAEDNPESQDAQEFTDSSPAFSGEGFIPFDITDLIQEVGSTGDIVAGCEDFLCNAVSKSIGQWEIIDSTSSCIANTERKECTDIDLNYTGGKATCNASGNAFDLSSCEYCGNAVREVGEFCDDTVPEGLTCSDVGFPDGTDPVTSCKTDCSGYDVSVCSLPSTDKSVDPAILLLLLKPQPSDDEG